MLDFQKKKQLAILIKIALVDEEFADSEKETIRKIGQRYGASDEDLTALFDAPPTNESLSPMTVLEKVNFMMDCILVVIADNVVTASEEYFAKQMAQNLGFNVDVIPFLIENKNLERKEMEELMLPFIIA